ncbi:MAG TPA: ABC transporter ATP-binding protein [Thermoanaerobaculia bacterium]|nr:ABC transporter ATP-binding protein [Thermoanaerobaculia bacterium]
MSAAVSVVNLRKTYGPLVAVDDLSFEVPAGAVFALTGPNGAGKTTTVECIEGLRKPDRGSVRVLGLDPDRDHDRLYERIGVQLQESGLYDHIKVREALELFASFFPKPLPVAELLDSFDLAARAESRFSTLSGGEKRKLLTALALVGRPELVILDEPTSGLDPHARQAFWATLGRFRRDGLSIILTTHDLQEAEDHASTVAVVSRGRLLAVGAPADLLSEHGLRERVSCAWAEATAPVADGEPGIRQVVLAEGRLQVFVDDPQTSTSLTDRLRTLGAQELALRRANLEDLYLILTGKGYRKEGEVTP